MEEEYSCDFMDLEHFRDEMLPFMGMAGQEERRKMDAAIAQVRADWPGREKILQKQHGAYYYEYAVKDGQLYDRAGKAIAPAMGKPVYLVFTSSAQSDLTKAIMAYTHSNYYHVSVALNENLMNLYSFAPAGQQEGQQGGFCSDSIVHYKRDNWLIRVSCVFVSETDYRVIMGVLSEFGKNDRDTKYNYQGLIRYILGRKEETNPYCMFCSQFVRYLFGQIGIELVKKEPCFTSPEDIASLDAGSGVYRLYDGEAGLYRKERILETVRSVMGL